VIERRWAGDLPPKHHIAFRDAAGALLHEECFTRKGFDGPYTLMYHRHRPHVHSPAPTAHGWPKAEAVPDQALLRRHFRTPGLAARGGPPVDARTPLLFNADLTFSVLFPTASDPVYVVNGDGDDLFYVHQGGGTLRTPLGDLAFQAGDYVHVPRGMIHRFLLPEGEAQHWIVFECAAPVGILSQWRNETGQLRMDAPYCHRDFRFPEFRGPSDEGLRDLMVKRDQAFHGFRLDHTPLDVVGWDGTVYPWAFPILNFQPRAGLVHLPPDWHGTFSTRNALICSFVPRALDFHPDAIPCPYPHASVDCDEILFYCKGNFTSRKGVGPGSVSLHPMGILHGPHPGSYEGSIGHRSTDELAVMMDTFVPLRATRFAAAVEDAGYHESFR
jgi:homogentisate 1,2-dioxygenase